MKTDQRSYVELSNAQQAPYPPFPGHVPLDNHLQQTTLEMSGPGHMPPTSFDHKRPLPSTAYSNADASSPLASPMDGTMYPTPTPVVHMHDAYSELSGALSQAGSNSHILVPSVMPYNSLAYGSSSPTPSEPVFGRSTPSLDGGGEEIHFINTGILDAATTEPMWSLQELIRRQEEETKKRHDAQIQAALAQAEENN